MINKTTISVTENSNVALKIKRFKSLLDILAAFMPLLVFGFIADRLGLKTLISGVVITVGYILTIITATYILKRRGTGWHEIGLARPKSWMRTILLGFASLVGAVVVIMLVENIAVSLPFVEVAAPDISRFNPLEGNVPLFLISVVLAWTSIAFGEEMFFRAFLTTKLGEVFQNTKLGWVLAAVGSSVAFGIAHYGEGPIGFYTNGAFGLLFALIYLRTGRRNLWITIIAHGLANTLRFALVFAGAV
jgi:membrane protease YdiL (CAAX protease family)